MRHARILSEALMAGAIVKTSSDTKQWKPLPNAPGNFLKILRLDKETGQQAILLRMEPGAHYPSHIHPGGEDVLVLEGSVQLGADRLARGDYLYTPPGGIHAASTREGCTMFITVGKPIEPAVPPVAERAHGME
jgi:quercetin dioxygenase-like cupin family protein